MPRFFTGHEVFDEVFEMSYGDLLVVLDETSSKGFDILSVLFRNYLTDGPSFPPLFIISTEKPRIDMEQAIVPIETLNDLSIAVNSIRQKAQSRVLIHGYLPDLMILESPENILKMFERWKRQVRNARNVEFFLIPKGVFPEFEKKFLSIMDGALAVETRTTEKGVDGYLVPLGACKPSYNGQRFSYMIEGGRLLLLWKDHFTDKFPPNTSEALRSKVEYYQRNLASLMVVKGETEPRIDDPASLLLPSYLNQRLSTMSLMNSDRMDEILSQVAEWELSGIVKVEHSGEGGLSGSSAYEGPTEPKRTISFFLSLPYGLSKRLIVRKKIRRVATDVYLAERRSILAFINLVMARYGKDPNVSIDALLAMERMFEEAVARSSFVERVEGLGESPAVRLELGFLEKVIKLTIFAAYGLDCKVEKVEPDQWIVAIPECFLCDKLGLSQNVCTSVEGGLTGALCLSFKERFSCTEIRCKANGNNECAFLVKIEARSPRER